MMILLSVSISIEQRKICETPNIYVNAAMKDTFHNTEDAVRRELVLVSKIDGLIFTSFPNDSISPAIPNMAQNIEPPVTPIAKLMKYA